MKGIHNGDEDDKNKKWNTKDQQVDYTSEGKTQNYQWYDEEHQDKIEDGEPPIISRRIAKNLSQSYRDLSHKGQWVPDYDAKDIEKEMTQGDLQGVTE